MKQVIADIKDKTFEQIVKNGCLDDTNLIEYLSILGLVSSDEGTLTKYKDTSMDKHKIDDCMNITRFL